MNVFTDNARATEQDLYHVSVYQDFGSRICLLCTWTNSQRVRTCEEAEKLAITYANRHYGVDCSKLIAHVNSQS